MSRRAIKRYEQQKLQSNNSTNDDEEDTDDLNPSPVASRTKNSKSPFSFLNFHDGEDEDDCDDEDDKVDENEMDDDITTTESKKAEADDENMNHGNESPEIEEENDDVGDVKVLEPDSQLTEHTVKERNDDEKEETEQLNQKPQAKKKKKKKKRKGRKRATNAPKDIENDPDWIALNEFEKEVNNIQAENEEMGFIPRSFFSPEDGDDVREEAKRIMLVIEQMAFPEQQQSASSASASLTITKALHVEPRFLNADAELKRLFGSRVVESERRDEEAASAASRRRRGMRTNTIRRKISLVSPRETWFDHAPGLIMEIDKEATNNSTDGIKYFRYAHEGSYARLQEEYRQVVGTHDPNFLVEICSKHPYHVDSLLQLAELHRQMGELDRAAEQIERCLYVMEASWPITFKPFDGSCRLKFDIIENRSLYVALFRYSQLLTRRGLHRTSLEISKLILNLDPDNDPMGMLMLADSYAVLSGEYDWVLDMKETYTHIPMRYFPNFALSAALSIDMKQQQSSNSKRSGNGATTSMGAGKRLGTREDVEKEGDNNEKQDSDTEAEMKAKEMLIDALLTFPMILKPLLEAVEDSSGVWTESRLFDDAWHSAGYSDGGVLIRMSRVYAERSKLLWNAGRAKSMLVSCARTAGLLDEKAGMGMDASTGRLTSAFVKDNKEHARVARCRALRIEAANWLAQCGLYRKVQIADFADSTTNLPAEILAGDAAEQTIGGQEATDVSMGRGVLEFLQSLLPWREARDARNNGDPN